MVYFFDGKMFSLLKKEEIKNDVFKLVKNGFVPTLASILVGPDNKSLFYTDLKRNFAEEVGCKLVVYSFKKDVSKEEIMKKIDKLNSNPQIHGIMLQLPLPDNFSVSDREEIINKIDKDKDVDGLRDDSSFVSPVVKSIITVLKEATPYIVRRYPRVLVVGSKGFEGNKIFKILSDMKYDVVGIDKDESKKMKEILKNVDIVISATGQRDLIKASYTPPGLILIDLGYQVEI